MAISLDSGLLGATAGSTNPVNVGIDVGATVKLLVLSIYNWDGNTTARGGTAPTYEGAAMTQAGTGQAGAAECYVELWYFLNPTTGASKTVSVPNTGTINLYCAVSSFIAASTTATFGTPQQTGTSSDNPSLTINNVPAGGMTIAVEGDGYKDPPTARSHTSIMEVDRGVWSANLQYGLIASLSNVTMSYTFGGSDDVAMIMAAFQEVAAGKMMSGVVSSVSSIAGPKPRLYMKLPGSVRSGTSIASAPLRLKMFLRGIIASGTSILGGVSRVAATVIRYLGGVVSSATSLLSNLRLHMKIGGAVASTTVIIGGVTRIGLVVVRYLSGVINCGTVIIGTVGGTLHRFLGGVVICANFVGDYYGGGWFPSEWFPKDWFPEGWAAVPIRLGMHLRGLSVAVSTSVFGGVTRFGFHLLSGVITCGTVVVNTSVRLYMGLQGTVATVTSIVGSVTGITTRLLTGVVTCGTIVIVSLSGAGSRLLSGIVGCSTAVTSQFVLAIHASGTILSATSVIFNLFQGAQHQFLSGIIICGPNRYFPEGYFDDYFYNPSALTGNLKLGFRLGGVIASTTMLLSEGIRLFMRLAGIITSGTVVIIGLTGISTWLLSGVIVCATAVTGRLQLIMHAAGAILTSTRLTSTGLRLVFRMSGVISSTTSVLARLVQYMHFGGAVICRTSVLAALRLYMRLAGAVSSTTRVVLGFFSGVGARLLGGVIVCGTVITGNFLTLGARLLGGVIACSMALVNTGLRLYLALAGTVRSVTSVTGMLLRRFSLAGTVICTTVVSAALRLYMRLAGAIASTTNVFGGFERLARHLLSGVIACTTSVITNVQRFGGKLLGGIIESTTALIASTFIARLLGGIIECTTTITGALSRLWTLAGNILSNTAVVVNLTQNFAQWLSGVIASGTSITGNFANVGRKFIGGVIVCGTYVYLGFLGGFSSAAGAGRHFIGGLHKWYIKFKQRLRIDP